MRTFLIATSLVLALAASGIAGAATGGRARDLPATPIFLWPMTLDANTSYTISTTSLSPATADTVLHVQDADDPNGGGIAGNDDFNGTLASGLDVPPSPAVRHVMVVVHAYSTASAGTGQLVVQWARGTLTQAISFGGTKYTVPAQIATTHLYTVQQQGGASDTVMLVSSGSIAHAIAFDDSDGIDKMSWIHINEACAPCTVIVGSTAPETAGATTLIWDDGMHQAQCDADGLGDGLEAAIGTDPCNPDTDGDGLSDGVEVIGANGVPAVKLPYYGADPLRKDIFLETHWVKCDARNTLNFDCKNNVDYFKLSPAQALQVASYFAPDVAVHIDTGVANADPATRTIYGDWGGTSAIDDGRDKCQDLTPARVGYFHHGLLHGLSGGQADSLNGYCFFSGTAPSAVAHELAHGFGLDHGGKAGAVDDYNSKPNYRSLMNYAFLYDPTVRGFSRNEHGALALNPTQIDETASIGSDVSYLALAPWGYKVRADGAVDWNRDGMFSTSVTAAITWAADSDDQSFVHADQFTGAQSQYPAAAWTHTQSGAARLYLVTRNRVTGQLQTRWTDPAHMAACRNPGSTGTCATWTPASTAPPGVLPGSLGGVGGPAVAGYVASTGAPQLLALYRDTAARLRAQTLTISTAGVEAWTAPATVGTETPSDDPAAIAFAGKIHVFAPVANQLLRWVFDPATATWSPGAVQRWTDGTPIQLQRTLALTVGYQTTVTGPQLFAMVPLLGTPSPLAMARYDSTADRWVRSPMPITTTLHRPGLAYMPFTSSVPEAGRFYVTYTAVGDVNQAVAFISMTEGNDPSPTATTRRLVFGPGAHVGNEWRVTNAGTPLVFAPGLDTNLRAFLSFQEQGASGLQASTIFAPLADGIFNVTMRDFDDYALIRAHLGCSLTRSCP
jgi:hypothetical protein